MIGEPSERIPGVRWGRTTRHSDERGSFRELWRASWFAAEEFAGTGPSFVQANVSASAVGVLRGLHLHQRQADFWAVAAGRAFVALVDVRPVLEGASAPAVETRELEADDWVVIPPGVAHGFLATEALELIYLVTNEFDGSDEHGFAWDDPLVDVPWPLVSNPERPAPILSERDRSSGSLADLVARLNSSDDGGSRGR